MLNNDNNNQPISSKKGRRNVFGGQAIIEAMNIYIFRDKNSVVLWFSGMFI